MPASPNELWWLFVVGTGVFLSLAVGIIAIVVLNQRRLLLAQREKMDALRKSEEEYSDLFHNVSDIVYIHSLDGTLLRVNARMCMFLGRAEEELVGKSVKEILAAKHHVRFDRYLKEIARDGESNGFLILTSKDGKENLFEYRNSLVIKDGKPVAVRGIARNVTEQKKAERALRESEERFRRLIKFSPVPIAVHSHGRWAYVNDAAVKLVCASSPEEIIGRPVLEFFKGENRKSIRKQIRSSLVAGNEVSVIVEKLHRLDSKEIEVEVVAIPIVYGGKRGGQVVVRDITEQKRLQDELARAQRLETAGRIAGQIAHDFNNLLAPLTAYPTLIREDLPEDHPAVELVNDMETAAEKIAEINQQLLTLGRRGHYAMEPVDLNDLTRKVVASQAFPRGVVVNQQLGKDLLPINGGKAQLGRALTNLILNASEAMDGMGVLTVKTENVYLEEPLKGYQTVKRGEYVKLSISDTGSGIDPSILDRIFDPFFSTKRMDRMRGSGLGLSIVHGVVEDHNGYLTVESALGKGTTFSLFFPITRSGHTKSDQVDQTVTGRGERILLVDDDPIQRRVAGQLLRRLGYKVQLASSGEEAVERIKRQPQDLVVLDMVMEGIDGAETYRRILEHRAGQKAIILSGYAVSHRVEEALRLGAGAFVSKPISPNVLASSIRKELDRQTPTNGNR